MRQTERYTRTTAIDHIMRDVESDYRSGRIGITDTGELVPLRDIYDDLQHGRRPTDYRIASARDMDRETHRTCRTCGCAYRTTDQTDPRWTPCNHRIA